MGSIKDLLYDDESSEMTSESSECEYPVRQSINGYDVNHYHEGDMPIYEIYDDNGKLIGIANSASEIREITSDSN